MRIRKYLDTSIILESFLENSPYGEQAEAILYAIEKGKERVITSPLNIAEVFYLLTGREKVPYSYVEAALRKFLQFPGLELIDLPVELIKSALPFACKYQIDLTDAVNKKLMEQLQIKEIYTLDSHFDTFKDIQRFTELKI